AGGAAARDPAPRPAWRRRRTARDRRRRAVAREAPRAMARARAAAHQHRVQRARSADAQRRPCGEQERNLGAGARPAARALRPEHRCPSLEHPPEARRRRKTDPYGARAGLSPGEGVAVGRLFWKIFLGFWLALVVAAVGAGTAVWVQRLERAREAPPPDLAVGPPSRLATDLAAATLRYGGVDALRQWMNDWQGRRPVPVFAVDGDGRDLLAREVPAGALAQ